MSRLWRITEGNITVAIGVFRVNRKALSTATTKSHSFTEIIIVARIWLLPRHPGHSARGIIMEIDCAVKLSNKFRAEIRLQANKFKETHLLQGINHKAVLRGLVHGKYFLVDGLGLHNDTILHTL